MGKVHTQTIAMLSDLYSSNSPPKNKLGIVHDFNQILASFCGDNYECRARATDVSPRQFQKARNNKDDMVTVFSNSSGFSLETPLEASIRDVETTLEQNNGDVDDVVSHLISIRNQVRGIDNVEERNKEVVRGVISIAMTGVQLWHDIYNDPDHPLYGVHHQYSVEKNPNHKPSKRRLRQQRMLQDLQGYTFFGPFNIGLKDIIPAIIAAIRVALEMYNNDITDPATLIVAMISCFVVGLVTDVIEGEDYYYDKDEEEEDEYDEDVDGYTE